MYLNIVETPDTYLKQGFFILKKALLSFSNIHVRVDEQTDNYWILNISDFNPLHPYQTVTYIVSHKDRVIDNWNKAIKEHCIPIAIKVWSDNNITLKIKLSYDESVFYKGVAEYEVNQILKT